VSIPGREGRFRIPTAGVGLAWTGIAAIDCLVGIIVVTGTGTPPVTEANSAELMKGLLEGRGRLGSAATQKWCWFSVGSENDADSLLLSEW
jgi:hypothetical protein